eukprot:4503561-Prymnesium_polylepis.2
MQPYATSSGWKSSAPGDDSIQRQERVSSCDVSGIQKLISPGWWPYSASRCMRPKCSLGPGCSRMDGGYWKKKRTGAEANDGAGGSAPELLPPLHTGQAASDPSARSSCA